MGAMCVVLRYRARQYNLKYSRIDSGINLFRTNLLVSDICFPVAHTLRFFGFRFGSVGGNSGSR